MQRIRQIVMAALLAGMGLTTTTLAQQPQQSSATQQAQPNMAQLHEKLASFRHEPLTVEKARAALEVFLTLREKYPPGTFKPQTPGPVGVTEAMKRSQAAQEIQQLMREKGFADIDAWMRTFTSLGMAVVHVREGEDNAEKKLKKLEAAPMPEQMKARIRAMLKAVIPPQENVDVVKKLLADAQTKKMIESVDKPQ